MSRHTSSKKPTHANTRSAAMCRQIFAYFMASLRTGKWPELCCTRRCWRTIVFANLFVFQLGSNARKNVYTKSNILKEQGIEQKLRKVFAAKNPACFFSKLNRRTSILGSRLRQMTRSKAVSHVLKRISLNPRRPLLKMYGLCLNMFIFSFPFRVAACAPPPQKKGKYSLCENSYINGFYLFGGFASFKHASLSGHRTRSGELNSIYIYIYQDILLMKGPSGGFTACKFWRLWHLFLPTYPAKLDCNCCVLGGGTCIALNLAFTPQLFCFVVGCGLLFHSPSKTPFPNQGRVPSAWKRPMSTT